MSAFLVTRSKIVIMNSQSHDGSSTGDTEGKVAPVSTHTSDKNSHAEGKVIPANSEYERYLDLHREFEGTRGKKLLRKRTDLPFTPPGFKLHALTSRTPC